MMRMAILAAGFAALFMVPAQAADDALSPQANAAFLAANAKKPGVIVEASGLQHRSIHTGFGKRPKATDLAKVNYKGMLIDGKVFDATEPGMPAEFTVNKLIPGWTEALQLMREGDEWELVIPAGLAYGTRGAGKDIGPNQTLIFVLTLISVTSPPPDQKKDDQSQ
jgi:FKBP-type peptidyl-prolyl cis-trans isomerase FklB